MKIIKRDIVISCCVCVLSILLGILIHSDIQRRSNQNEIDVLKFELRKHGILKGYTNTDYDIIKDNSKYLHQDPALVWAIVKAENARDVAIGGMVTPISPEIMRRENPEVWAHKALGKSLLYYQFKFIRNHNKWFGDFCNEHREYTTKKLLSEFFWCYRSKFIDELGKCWLAPHDDVTAWKKNVLIFWKQERR